MATTTTPWASSFWSHVGCITQQLLYGTSSGVLGIAACRLAKIAVH